jgi:hypothetical protein
VSAKYRLSKVKRTGSRLMMSGDSFSGSVCHCFSVYPRTKASYSGLPISEIAFSSRLLAAPSGTSAACSRTSARAWSGLRCRPAYWQMVARLIGIG